LATPTKDGRKRINRRFDALRARTPEEVDALRESCFRTKRTLDGDEDPWTAIALAQRDDELGFRYLYLHYADNVYSYVRTILRDDHEAEDVTQQVFTTLLTRIQSYEKRGVPFSAWLLRIARNAAIDHLRRSRMVLAEEVRGTEHEIDEIGQDRRWSLTAALENLPEDQRQVVILRHLIGLSPPEIAERMGKTESAVHALHHRGRRKLRGHLVEAGSAPAQATR
jgi:RNA polymerase sigma-70 factor (ECF subfamily)